MENTIEILLYKLLELEISLEEFYENLSQSDFAKANYALKNTAGILAAEEGKHIDVYRRFVKEMDLKEDYIIDDHIMGEVDYLLVSMKQAIQGYGIVTAGHMIAKAIDNENKQIFLISRITELLRKEPLPSFINEMFLFLLNEEQRHLSNLMPFNKM